MCRWIEPCLLDTATVNKRIIPCSVFLLFLFLLSVDSYLVQKVAWVTPVRPFSKHQPVSWFFRLLTYRKTVSHTLATVTYVPLWLNYEREAGRQRMLGYPVALQIPADVCVVWADHVTLTTRSIPVFRAGPCIYLDFTNITTFV